MTGKASMRRTGEDLIAASSRAVEISALCSVQYSFLTGARANVGKKFNPTASRVAFHGRWRRTG
jgi:hypothetical protein